MTPSKKTDLYKQEVAAVQGAFRLFAEPVGKDTGSTAFVKAIGGGTKEVLGNQKRIYIDGYDRKTSKRVVEVNFWYEKVLNETDSLKRQRFIKKALKAFYLFNLSREKGMVKCLKRKVKQGEIVGFPVGLLHRDGLERLLKKARIPFKTITSFMAKSKLTEDDKRMGDACHFKTLSKEQKKVLFEYAQKKWVPEVK